MADASPGFRLSAALAESVRNASVEALAMSDDGTAESAGLIAVTAAPPGAPEQIKILELGNLFAGSAHLSEASIRRLHEAAAGCEAKGNQVVAFLRIRTRAESPEPYEYDAAELICRVPAAALVLTTPSPDGSARIRLFRHGGDAWTEDQDFQVGAPEFPRSAPNRPFRTKQHAPDQRKRNRAPHFAQPSTTYRREHNELVRVSHPEKSRFRLLPYGAALLITGILVGLWIRSGALGLLVAGAKGSSPNLGLTVRQEPGILRITWNPDSPAAKSAVEGVLEISDAEIWNAVRLRPSEMRDASLVYAPKSRDVTFRLVLRDVQDRESQERVRFIGAMTPAFESDSPLLPPPGSDIEQKKFKTPRASETAPAVAPQHPPAADSGNTAGRDSGPPAPSGRSDALRTEFPRNSPSASPQQQSASEPAHSETAHSDQIRRAPEPGRSLAALVPPALPASAPPGSLPAPAFSGTVLPAPPQSLDSQARREGDSPAASEQALPRSESPSGSIVVPAVPIQRTQPLPVLRQGWRVASVTKIDVIVSIDAAGRVTSARPDADSRGKDLYLVGLCLQAAREWQFRPASRNGQFIPSEYRVGFVFSPPAR